MRACLLRGEKRPVLDLYSGQVNSRLAASTSSPSCLWACASQGCGEAEGATAWPRCPLPRLPAAPQPPGPQRAVGAPPGDSRVRTGTRNSEEIHPLPTDEMGEAGEARLPYLLAPSHLCDCPSPAPAHWEGLQGSDIPSVQQRGAPPWPPLYGAQEIHKLDLAGSLGLELESQSGGSDRGSPSPHPSPSLCGPWFCSLEMIFLPPNQVPCLQCPAQLIYQLILPGLIKAPPTLRSLFQARDHDYLPDAGSQCAECLSYSVGRPTRITTIYRCLQLPGRKSPQSQKASSRNMLRKVDKKPGKKQCCCLG